MNRISYLFFLFLSASSCQIGTGGTSALSSNVHVIVAPQGVGDKIFSRRPIIFINGSRQACRPHSFRISEARNVLKKEGVETEFLDNFFGIDSNEVEGDEGEGQNQEEPRSGKSIINVGDNWLKFGLWISNTNAGKNNFFLVIDNLTYSATATYKRVPYTHSGNISSGYCEGSTPYLYFVPPKRKVTYQPLSRNPFHNLTIFLEGFPLLDRSSESSIQQQRRVQSLQQVGATNTGIGSVLGHHNNTPNSTEDKLTYSSNEIKVIPEYTVELTLSGYFMTKSGQPVANFVKRVQFFTQSHF